MGFDIPILLILYKRPESTQRCIEVLWKIKPNTILVAADGPRDEAEQRQCFAARQQIDKIDWLCEIERDFSDYNLGCGVRVYTAVDWALSLHEAVIVLEDDCIAHPSFFSFCQNVLNYYRDDERIMHISGNNFQPNQPSTRYSYYFSKYTHAWGWATWRRAWQYFDWRLNLWPEFKALGGLGAWCSDPLEINYWTSIFDMVHGGSRDIWDYQWNATCLMQSGLAVLPNVNLVANIGFGEDATHTKNRSAFLELPVHDIGEIVHPPVVMRNVEADKYTFNHNFGGVEMRKATTWQNKMFRTGRRFLRPLRQLRRFLGNGNS
jgi:hypothetical protein